MSDDKSYVSWLQSRLTAHGFATGGIDGITGPNTRAAIERFQRKHDLPITGMSSPALDAKLREPSSRIPVGANLRPLPDRDVDPERAAVIRGNFPRQRDVLNYYGPVGQNTVLVPVPWRMRLAWDKRRTIARMSLHQKVADSAVSVFERVKSEYGDDGIKHIGVDLFGGSLNVRRMRGGTRYSMHSWAIAIDFDPANNALRTKRPNARLSRADCEAWWRVWEEAGWLSLGRARDFDWMHVQAAHL